MKRRTDEPKNSAFRKFEPCVSVEQLPMLSVGPGSPLNRLTMGIQKLMQKSRTGEHVVKGGFSLPDGRLDLGKNLPLLANRYAFVRALGEGGSAQVIIARDLWSSKRREVVIKVMKLQYAKCGEQEIRLLRYVNACDPHGMAHCVRLLSCFCFAGHTCMVLEKLGKSLLDYIGEASKLPREKFVQQLRKIATQLLTCLSFLRSINIVHADIKPENILFTNPEGRITSVRLKVVDFGNAFCAKSDADVLLGSEVQTPYYRAPEVLLGMRYGTQIDLWSLGCILTELCLQRPLFPCSTPKQLLSQIVAAMGRPPPEHMMESANQTELKAQLLTKVIGIGDAGVFQALAILDTDFADLIKQLLEYDPSQRLRPEMALCHPFCTSLFPFHILAQTSPKGFSRHTWLTKSLVPNSLQTEETPPTPAYLEEPLDTTCIKLGDMDCTHAGPPAEEANRTAFRKATSLSSTAPNPIKLHAQRPSPGGESPAWLQGMKRPGVCSNLCGSRGVSALKEIADTGDGLSTVITPKPSQGKGSFGRKRARECIQSVPEYVDNNSTRKSYLQIRISPSEDSKDLSAKFAARTLMSRGKIEATQGGADLYAQEGAGGQVEPVRMEENLVATSAILASMRNSSKNEKGSLGKKQEQTSAWHKAQQILQINMAALKEPSPEEKEMADFGQDDGPHESPQGDHDCSYTRLPRHVTETKEEDKSDDDVGVYPGRKRRMSTMVEAPGRTKAESNLQSTSGAAAKTQTSAGKRIRQRGQVQTQDEASGSKVPRGSRARVSAKPWWIASTDQT